MAVETPVRILRVASVPAAHAYVEHLGIEGAVRLAEPDPRRRWPPAMLDAGWVEANAAEFDLMHLHFGAESVSRRGLEGALAALHDAGRPLVYTAHDLENPQLRDQSAHWDQLGLLMDAAAAVITLTPGAAAEIERRWGRRARVIAHPYVHPLDAALPVGSPSREPVIGLHLRDMRPNVDGLGAVARTLEATAGTGARVRVLLNDVVRDEAAGAAVRALCAHPRAELVVRPRPADAALARELADLDVAVLPYRHGTHSGWLELCWDLGVAVASPAVGFFAEQQPGVAALDPAGLASLIARRSRPGTRQRGGLQRDRRRERGEQRAGIAAAHGEVYRAALARMDKDRIVSGRR